MTPPLIQYNTITDTLVAFTVTGDSLSGFVQEWLLCHAVLRDCSLEAFFSVFSWVSFTTYSSGIYSCAIIVTSNSNTKQLQAANQQ